MSRKRPARKVRVEFRQNRQVRRRADDWTQRFRTAREQLEDVQTSESVRAKGDLSRKRTIVVGDDDQRVVDEALWRPGRVTKVHGLFVYVTDDEGRAWECTVRRVLRTLLIRTRAPVLVGDRVWLSDQARMHDGRPVGVIERVAPRVTTLSRRDVRGREHAIVANAEQLLAVVSVAQPRLRPHLLDRYIVAALKGGLQPILCFNKMDLLDAALAARGGADPRAQPDPIDARDAGASAPADETDEADEDAPLGGPSVSEVVAAFRSLGYRCLCTSVVTGAGLDELREVLRGRLTALSGQSGVGKSSLLNALQPGLRLPTASVSAENEKGRHTTTLAELLPLDFGGFVVDTPGIRAFELWAVAPGELEAFFVEFLPYVARCRFHNCLHRGEEGCAVRAAVEDGAISRRRYRSYLKMLAEL